MDSCGCGDAIVRRRGAIGIIPDKVFCDYFEWLQGTARGINAYNGEYMSQFEWAKETRVSLEMKETAE
jgi:hypothetical protein